jgi:hypothetical protein
MSQLFVLINVFCHSMDEGIFRAKRVLMLEIPTRIVVPNCQNPSHHHKYRFRLGKL